MSAATPPERAATAGPAMDRVELARIIDPTAWRTDSDGFSVEQTHSGDALAKADQIIRYAAALPADQPPAAQAPAIPAGMVGAEEAAECWLDARAAPGHSRDRDYGADDMIDAFIAGREAATPKPAAQEDATALGEENERLRAALTAEDEYWAASRAHASALPRLREGTGAAFSAASARRDEARAALSTPPRRVDDAGLREALDDLQAREADYRKAHDLYGDDDLRAGHAWDKMRRAGDRARAALATHSAPAADHGAEAPHG